MGENSPEESHVILEKSCPAGDAGDRYIFTDLETVSADVTVSLVLFQGFRIYFKGGVRLRIALRTSRSMWPAGL